MDKTIVSSTYFHVGETGNMNLAVVGSNETGNSVVRFKIRDKTYDVTISGPTSKIYGIATIPIKKSSWWNCLLYSQEVMEAQEPHK